MDFIQYTLSALDSDYDGFVDPLTHMHGMLTFDDVRNKLLVYEQCVQFLRQRNNGSLTCPAFIVSTISQSDSRTTLQAGASNPGQSKNNRNNFCKNNKKITRERTILTRAPLKQTLTIRVCIQVLLLQICHCRIIDMLMLLVLFPYLQVMKRLRGVGLWS